MFDKNSGPPGCYIRFNDGDSFALTTRLCSLFTLLSTHKDRNQRDIALGLAREPSDELLNLRRVLSGKVYARRIAFTQHEYLLKDFYLYCLLWT